MNRSARRIRRISLTLAAAVLANELGYNVWYILDRLAHAKVLSSVSDETWPMLGGVASTVAALLLLVVFATVVLCTLWGWACTIAHDAVTERMGRRRVVRWAFWFVATFAFLNTYYSLHDAWLPHSGLKGSPLFMLVGAVEHLDAPSLATRGVLAATVPVLVAILTVACHRSRAYRRSCVATALAVTVAIGGYDFAKSHRVTEPFTADGNIIVLGLDSFQLNRLPVGGHPRDLAPAVNAFLEDARLFDNVWTPLARTYPSWLSILTGRAPVRHGARFNLVPDEHLSPTNRYLGAELAAQGYTTFHATDETRFSIIREGFGFQELMHPRMGFEDLFVGTFFDFSVANLLRQSHLGHDLFPVLANNRATVGYNPSIWTDNLLDRIDALPRDRPAFVAVHLCGNHWPFSTPAPYAYEGLDRIEGSIAMVDDQVRRILAHLDETGLSERSTVILLSDHGDGWSGDHADETNFHGDTVSDITSNKTFIAFRGPGFLPGRSSTMARTYDLYPTLLDLAGAGPAQDIDGESLLTLLSGRGRPRPVFAESGLDRAVYTPKKLVEEHSHWYRIDPGTGLVTMRREGYAEFLPLKSYSVIRDDRRLMVQPFLNKFRLHAFDPEAGRDVGEIADAPDAEKIELLSLLAESFELELAPLMEAARFRGFVNG